MKVIPVLFVLLLSVIGLKAATPAGAANWRASGTTNSTLAGTASAHSLKLGGTTNIVSDNGTNVTRNGVPVGNVPDPLTIGTVNVTTLNAGTTTVTNYLSALGLKLNNKTNIISDTGLTLTYNGNAINGVGQSLIWDPTNLTLTITGSQMPPITNVAPRLDFTDAQNISPADAGTTLNLNYGVGFCTLTGNVTFAYSFPTTTNWCTFQLQISNAQATNCTLTFPANTRKYGIIGYQSAGKSGRISLEWLSGITTNAYYVEAQ